MQLSLFPEPVIITEPKSNGTVNKIETKDRAFHNWYRFVLSYPPHLVREYIHKFSIKPGQTILDPFCGTGTTIIEAKMCGINSIGVEANPMACFASSVKTDWNVNPDGLKEHALKVIELIKKDSINTINSSKHTLSKEAFSLLLKDSISPIPLQKSLSLLEKMYIQKDDRFFKHELLAFAKSLVSSASNIYFGPEVGVRRIKKQDALVVENWLNEIKIMANDLRFAKNRDVPSIILNADSRQLHNLLQPNSIDLVFTSPPYPNEKDYTRTTRLESVFLGFIKSKDDLRKLKKGLLCSNTRNVYKDDEDDRWVAENEEVQKIAESIEKRRLELGKTSGFERLYGKVTKLYFGGITRHLAELRTFLKPGAVLGYVVGDQASYLRVMIHTGQLIAGIAKSLGYELNGIDLFRTRYATVTKKQMREEVVVLRWLG